LVGIILKLTMPGRLDRFSIMLYLVIGWSGIVLWEDILAFPNLTLWLLGAGALLYTTGVIFHVWESLRFQNAIWHAFVLLATACHYGAVLSAVVFIQDAKLTEPIRGPGCACPSAAISGPAYKGAPFNNLASFAPSRV
jgi:hemolysin III